MEYFCFIPIYACISPVLAVLRELNPSVTYYQQLNRVDFSEFQCRNSLQNVIEQA